MNSIKVMLYDKHTNINDILYANGKIADRFCLKLMSTENIKGDYVLDATFVADDKIDYYLAEENVLKVLCDYGYEVFYITKVVSSGKYIDITARQITIDMSLGLWLEDVRPTSLNGQDALNYLLSNAEGNNDYTFNWLISLESDILITKTAYYLYQNLDQALRGSNNSFLNTWGGEIKRRMFNIEVNNSIGSDKGVELRHKQNIILYEYSSNIDETYQKVRGVGFNGLRGNWITSENSYKAIKRKEFNYNIRVSDGSSDENYTYFDTEELAIAELDRLAALELSSNNVDEINKNYRVKYIDIFESEEYKNKYTMGSVYTGDYIRLYIHDEDIDETLEVTQREYDHIKQRVVDMVLSNNKYIPSGGIPI